MIICYYSTNHVLYIDDVTNHVLYTDDVTNRVLYTDDVTNHVTDLFVTA